MSDIFKDMQANVGCDYISNLPSSHLQEHGKFLVTEHGIFELPE